MTNYREMLHRSVIGIPLIEVVPLIFFSDPQGNMMLIREKDALYWKMPGSSLTPDMNLTECLKASILNDFGVLIEESILLHIFSDPSQIYLDDDNTQVFPIYLVFLPVKIRGALRQKIENGSEIRFFLTSNISEREIFPPMWPVISYLAETFPDDASLKKVELDGAPSIINS